MSKVASTHRRSSRLQQALPVVLALLITIVIASFVVRLLTDASFLLTGEVPEADDFENRYVEHPVLAYLHIVPGVIYLLGAPLQLSRRFRTRHYTFHRRLGRVLLGAGLLSGSFALVFGIGFAFGGIVEAAATAVFGSWFLVCLVLAYRAITRGDVVHHRQWMIRAFAAGVAVGTIRIWLGLFAVTGLLSFRDSFAAAFWIAFAIHVIAAEWWIRSTPALKG
jgi:hypothetical protein